MFAVLSILCSNIITLPLRVRAPCFVPRPNRNLNPSPKCCSAACQAPAQTWVSLSACQQVEWEMRWAGEAWQGGAAAVHLPLACLCFCYSFILICLPLRFIFLRFFSLPAPFHSFSPFSPHFVSHFSCSFNLENSEKRAQSNKIKLGFIDPFQFDSLTPPRILLLPLDCFLPSVSICSFFFFFCSSLGCPVGFAFVQQLN